MSLANTFPDFWSLLGGSIYRDVYKGNFAEARRLLEAQELEDIDDPAKIQLTKAILGHLSGELAEAEQILNAMRARDSSFSSTWQLRAEIYSQPLLMNGSNLRAFDGCVDDPAFQIILMNSLKKIAPIKMDDFEPGIWTSEHQIENMMVNADVWAAKLRTMSSLIPQNSPKYPRGGSTMQQNLVRSVMSNFANPQLPGCPTAYRLKMEAELAHIQGLPTSYQLLRASYDAYRAEGQLAGEALCRMIEGDWACSQQFSNIIALNMVICANQSEDGSSVWDSVEDALQRRDSNDARSGYDEAQRMFHDADAPRGVAAMDLRKGCLTIFELLMDSGLVQSSGNDLYAEARVNFQTSRFAFELAGDHLSVKLVEAHIIILDILSLGASRAEAAAAIGNWGQRKGNIQYVHDLGLLLLRLGNFQWRKKRAFDSSRLLLEAAQALFAGLGDHIAEVQAEAAGANILSQVLDLVSARVMFLSAERKLNQFMHGMSERAPPQLWQPQCELIGISLNRAMTSTFFHLGDVTTLKRILGVIQISESGLALEIRKAQEPQLILYVAKLQSKEMMQADDMAGALDCLNHGNALLSALDLDVYGEAREVARINLLGEMMRYEEARAIVRDMARKEEQKSDSERDVGNQALQRYVRTATCRIILQSALNALDFELAVDYLQKVDDLDDIQYIQKDPNILPQSAEALYFLSCLHEGLGDKESAIIRANACINAIEVSRSNISEPTARTTSFGHNEAVEAFDVAVRICFHLHRDRHQKPPFEINCNPRLKGRTWIEQALIFAEQGKARSMVESIHVRMNKIVQSSDVQGQLVAFHQRKVMEQMAKSAKMISRLEGLIGGTDSSSQEEREKLLAKLSAEKLNLQSLEKEFAQATAQVTDQYKLQSFAGMRTFSNSSDIFEELKDLPSDTVVLEFTTAYDGIGVFVIDFSGILASEWVQINKLELQHQISDFLRLMRREGLQDQDLTPVFGRIVRFLSRKLIKPVAPLIEERENIIMVPSGVLANFPLSMLETSSGPLMLSHTITQIPSLSAWHAIHRKTETQDPPKEKAKASVFCNSKRVKDGLFFVRTEAAVIARKFSTSPTVTDKMSPDKLRDVGQGCDILHLCAHGTFDPDAPLLSTIKLFPKNPEDNISVMDVANLIGPARLVVLSACFSGFGKILGSNDGYAFSHALLSIGVKAFVGSLWGAEDGSAMIFMYIFYCELLSQPAGDANSSSKTTIAQAFTAAQRQLRTMAKARYESCIDNIISELQQCNPDVLKDMVNFNDQLYRLKLLRKRDPARFQDPYYWAAFVLIGDGFQCI